MITGGILFIANKEPIMVVDIVNPKLKQFWQFRKIMKFLVVVFYHFFDAFLFESEQSPPEERQASFDPLRFKNSLNMEQ